MTDEKLLEDRIPRLISPKYVNLADLEEDEFPLDLALDFNRWFEIPAKEEEELGQRGYINDLIVIPEKNIQADLFYAGEIRCKDSEEHLFEIQSFPPENPLFHSENMEVVKDGHYRFTTKHCPNKIKYDRPFLQLLTRTELNIIFDEVRQSKNNNARRKGFYDFEELLEEYRTTGKISGDCKAISTFTAGKIKQLGLKVRTVSGKVHDQKPEDDEGHMWAEAFIHQKNGKGYWVPVDPAVRIFWNFPSQKIKYSLWSDLPSFKDQSIETARLRLQYV